VRIPKQQPGVQRSVALPATGSAGGVGPALGGELCRSMPELCKLN